MVRPDSLCPHSLLNTLYILRCETFDRLDLCCLVVLHACAGMQTPGAPYA